MLRPFLCRAGFVAALSLPLLPVAAQAEDAHLGISLGSLDRGHKEIYLRYQSGSRLGPFHYAVGGSISDKREAWVGVGLLYEQSIGQGPFFVQASVLPGFYNAGFGKDLGGYFEIRSGIDVGIGFAGGSRLSLGIDHRSNASTNRKNPGLNAVQVRYSIPIRR